MYSVQEIFQHHFQSIKVQTILDKIKVPFLSIRGNTKGHQEVNNRPILFG